MSVLEEIVTSRAPSAHPGINLARLSILRCAEEGHRKYFLNVYLTLVDGWRSSYADQTGNE